jgi:hypothetical protein
MASFPPHPSHFATNGAEVHLEGATSEWLFATGFWDEVNAALGLLLSQYEDDEVQPLHLSKIAEKIALRQAQLEDGANRPISFRTGWSANGAELRLSLSPSTALRELQAWREFLLLACAKEEAVDFYL